MEARRLLDRHLGRLPASGDAIDIAGNVAEQTHEIDAVAHHRPRFRDLAERADRGDVPVQQRLRDYRAITQEERAGRNGHGLAGRVLHSVQRGGVVRRLTRHLDQEGGNAKRLGGLGRRIGLVPRRRVPQEPDAACAREHLAQSRCA